MCVSDKSSVDCLISGWAGSSLWPGLCSSCGAGLLSRCGCGLLLSCCGERAPGRRCGLRESWLPALERRLSGCDAQAEFSGACGIFLDQAAEPMSPESVGGFFDTEPLGKARDLCFNLLHTNGVETEVRVSARTQPLTPRGAAEAS